MRILAISIDSSLLKEGSSALQRQKRLARLVEKYRVITLGRGERQRYGNLEIIPSNSSKSGFLFAAYRLAKEHAKDSDLVTVQDPFIPGLVGVLLKKNCGLPLEVQLHGDDVFNNYWIQERPVFNRIMNFLAAYVLRNADSVRTVSRKIRERVVDRGVPEEKITVVPVYTDLRKFSVKRTPERNLVLFVGRIVPQKNPFLLLRAWKIVLSKCPDARLVVVGDGFLMGRMERIVRSDEDLERSVTLAGFGDPRKFYRRAGLFVLPSFYEGWGLVVIEAMAAGIPVVMSDVGCAGEVVIDGKNGVVVPVNDLDAFADAVVRMLHGKGLQDKYGREGRMAVRKLLSEKETFRLYMKSWKKALK
jgi:glycosyltransferase involved in cell wall biosynthesis